MKRSLVLSACLIALCPLESRAHLVNTGFGPFYDGLCHPFVNPTDLMMIFSLSLLAGYAGPTAGRHTLFTVIFAWFVGAVMGYTSLNDSWGMPVVVSAALILLISVLIASNLKCPKVLLGVTGMLVGLCFGVSNGVEMAALSKGSLWKCSRRNRAASTNTSAAA